MSKKVISFRLSSEDLAALDESAQRFGISRSEALSAAIRVFKKSYVQENGTFVHRTPWWFESIDGKTR